MDFKFSATAELQRILTEKPSSEYQGGGVCVRGVALGLSPAGSTQGQTSA